MARSIELSGDSLSLVLYALQLTVLVLALLFVALPLDSPASVLLATVFTVLAVVAAVGLWRKRTHSEDGSHLGTVEDITYDPFADPGQAAKDRWEKAVRRLPGDDDDRD